TKAQAVGGVMGGAHSEVSPATTTILLESAYFDPASVRKTSKSLELTTDASYRFERGADYLLQSIACRRAAALIEQIAGGNVYPVLDVAPLQFAPKDIQLRHERMTRVLGSRIDPEFVENTFGSLGFTKQGENVWRVPSFRVDVHREIDLIEEVARHYGYNKFPETLPAAERKYQPDYPTYELERSVEQLLRAAKVDEAYTYSLVAGKSDSSGLKLLNPISEAMMQLRSTMAPGLLDSIEYNLRHRNQEVRLFEIGRVFLPQGEKVALGIALLGEYRELKGIIESIMTALGYPQPLIQEGKIVVAGTPLGAISQMEVEGSPAQLCEMYLSDLILLPKQSKRYQPIIPFPFVERDISFFISDNVPYAEIEQALTAVGIADLRSITLADRYQGSNVPVGRVSLTMRLVFQSDTRTLTSEEVDILYEKIVNVLQSRFAIELRR
ncbi:MAG TPA: phenylalanine--tRNA ligase subunit beta, partial [Acidobacteriota bacterium]|nr:phenylalanine--tRNA ligase subunit beta [Acidobacteriota bacterium]